ncbi:hypothetical protein V6N11_029236 [Hibiscus sabdariffa]|uniref:Myb/SANT-like domain-containing protein n=1 Tax=Hibiscus sabdariffa TaxID=183260 RepID=A0ABR2A8W5_9ROSI
MVEEENIEACRKAVKEDDEPKGGLCYCFWGPIHWFKMLAVEMHWSFVFGVVSIYGINQGFGGALYRIGTEYYMKDVQKVQPSKAQVYSGITSIPWIIKPVWGLLTDVLLIMGYRRRPYFILSGLLGVVSMLFISLESKMQLVSALLTLTAGNTAVAVADVTVDACVAQNSVTHPSRAADMQSLCALSYSFGGLLGFSISGVFIHLIGPKGVFGLLTLPAALVSLVSNFAYSEVNRKFLDAAKAMWTTLKGPDVWRPCLYMYLSLAVSLNINEGLFYWYTDAKEGPSFSKETVGYIFSMCAIGALLGAILYQNVLKNQPLRDMLFWTQLLFGLTGMLDLMLVQRMNLKFGIPDYLFVVIGEAVSQMITRLKWMPMLVLSSKLCPSSIEGTFFALLMSIDNFGGLSASWGGGLLLHVLNVTRTKFDDLWLVILIRNVLRVCPICLLFLVPKGDPNSFILSTDDEAETPEPDNIELVSLIHSAPNYAFLLFLREYREMGSQAPASNDRTRTYWTPTMERYFIDLMLEQMHRGNRVGHTFSKQAWTDMLTVFNAKFGSQYDKDVLKSRYTNLWKQFNDVKNLLGQNGFSWDESRQMVVADEYVWNAYIKACPDARSYKTKAVLNFNDLCLIYGYATADGRYSRSSHDLDFDDEVQGLNMGEAMSSFPSTKNERPRTEWNADMDQYFIELMLDQLGRGNKVDNTFSKQAWTDMLALFNARFGHQHGKRVLRHRYKKMWKYYSDLKVILKQNGFTWDETQLMVTADNDVWDAYIKAHPHARTYKMKTLPSYNDLRLIYGEAIDDGGLDKLPQEYDISSTTAGERKGNATSDRTRTFWTPPMDRYLIDLLLDQETVQRHKDSS